MKIMNNIPAYQSNKNQIKNNPQANPSFGAILGKTEILETVIKSRGQSFEEQIIKKLINNADDIKNIKTKDGDQALIHFSRYDEEELIDRFEIFPGEYINTGTIDVVAIDPKNPDSKEMQGRAPFSIEGFSESFFEGLITAIKTAVKDIGEKVTETPNKMGKVATEIEEQVAAKPQFSFKDLLNKVNGND